MCGTRACAFYAVSFTLFQRDRSRHEHIILAASIHALKAPGWRRKKLMDATVPGPASLNSMHAEIAACAASVDENPATPAPTAGKATDVAPSSAAVSRHRPYVRRRDSMSAALGKFRPPRICHRHRGDTQWITCDAPAVWSRPNAGVETTSPSRSRTPSLASMMGRARSAASRLGPAASWTAASAHLRPACSQKFF